MMKYEMTNETMSIGNGVTLHRIKALKSFGNVKSGDLGGWIEKEDNLSQSECAWVCEDAKISGNTRVSENARISGNAWVYGNAKISGDAWVYGNADISGDACIFGNADILGNADISGDACIFGNARIFGNADISGDAKISGNAWVSEDAIITNNSDFITIGPIGSRDDYITFFKTNINEIYVNAGCFSNTIDEFRKAVKETHGDNEHAKAYLLAIELAKLRIGLN